MQKIQRLKAVLAALTNKHGHLAVTSLSLAEKSEVSRKTILRDIQELNCLFNIYLTNNQLLNYDYGDETDPISFDWARKTFRIRKELHGLTFADLLGSP